MKQLVAILHSIKSMHGKPSDKANVLICIVMCAR